LVSFIESFNVYAKKNGMDIELHSHTLTPSNSSVLTEDFGSSMEYLLKKKSQKYDLYLYDTMYSRRYYPYFIDLKTYLPKEHMELYNTEISRQTCTYKGKWVGLVSNTYKYLN